MYIWLSTASTHHTTVLSLALPELLSLIQTQRERVERAVLMN
jgi:hypothetical protein